MSLRTNLRDISSQMGKSSDLVWPAFTEDCPNGDVLRYADFVSVVQTSCVTIKMIKWIFLSFSYLLFKPPCDLGAYSLPSFISKELQLTIDHICWVCYLNSLLALSHWCIFHQKKAELVVQTWDKQFHNSQKEQKVPFLYLANDILQNSKRKGTEFVSAFWKVLPAALKDVFENGDEHGKNAVSRLVCPPFLAQLTLVILLYAYQLLLNHATQP